MKINRSNKKLPIKPEMVLAARSVLMAMAFTETIKPVALEMQKKVLEEIEIFDDKVYHRRNSPIAEIGSSRKSFGERITSFEKLYLSADEEAVQKIYQKYDQLQRERKLLEDKDDLGVCALLKAENLERKAKRVLVDMMQPITKMSVEDILSSKNGIENFERVVELTLQMLASKI